MLEAKAIGLKVIASNLPALREITEDDTVFLNPLDGSRLARRDPCCHYSTNSDR